MEPEALHDGVPMGSSSTYSAEFKREAVALTREQGRTIVELARNLGIDRSVLRA